MKMRTQQYVMLFVILLLLAGGVLAQALYADVVDVLQDFNFDDCVGELGTDTCVRLEAAALAFNQVPDCDDQVELPPLPAQVSIPQDDEPEQSVNVTAEWTEHGCFSAATIVDQRYFNIAFLRDDRSWHIPDGGTYATGLGNSEIVDLFEMTSGDARIAALVLRTGTESTPYSLLVWQNGMGQDSLVWTSYGTIQGIGAFVSAELMGEQVIVTGEGGRVGLQYMSGSNAAFWEPVQ